MLRRLFPASDAAAVARLTDGRILDLGCGGRKAHPDYVGIDALDLPGVDIVGDVGLTLDAVADSSVDGVVSRHFFEHVDDVPAMLASIARVLKPAGTCDIVVPHFSNAYFYSDPTHRTAFGLYSLAYLARSSLFRREVPVYGNVLPLRLVDVQLRFKSPRPFYGRYPLRRAMQPVVNSSRWAQEFYEENLTGHLLLRDCVSPGEVGSRRAGLGLKRREARRLPTPGLCHCP